MALPHNCPFSDSSINYLYDHFLCFLVSVQLWIISLCYFFFLCILSNLTVVPSRRNSLIPGVSLNWKQKSSSYHIFFKWMLFSSDIWRHCQSKFWIQLSTHIGDLCIFLLKLITTLSCEKYHCLRSFILKILIAMFK